MKPRKPRSGPDIPPDELRCTATTKPFRQLDGTIHEGHRCVRPALREGLCGQHSPTLTKEKAEARARNSAEAMQKYAEHATKKLVTENGKVYMTAAQLSLLLNLMDPADSECPDDDDDLAAYYLKNPDARFLVQHGMLRLADNRHSFPTVTRKAQVWFQAAYSQALTSIPIPEEVVSYKF